jgi:hypothetical protein
MPDLINHNQISGIKSRDENTKFMRILQAVIALPFSVLQLSLRVKCEVLDPMEESPFA